MELYKASNALKTGKLTANRPVAMVAIGIDDVADITNETVSFGIESAQDGSTRQATSMSLLALMALSQHGQGGGFIVDGVTYFNIPVAENGSLGLETDENFFIQLDGLKIANEYAVELIEGGEAVGEPVMYDAVTFSSDETTKNVNTEGFDFMAIRGAANLTEIQASLEKTGSNRKYSTVGMSAMQAEQNDFAYNVLTADDGVLPRSGFSQDVIVLNCSYWREVELIKAAGNVVNIEFIKS